MNVDGTGVLKKMSELGSEYILEHTTYMERVSIGIDYGASVSLVDKLINRTRKYTPENAALVRSLFERAIQNNTKSK